MNPGAYFINADLTSPDTEASYDEMIKVWAKMLMTTGLDSQAAKASTSQWKKMVAVSKAEGIEAMLSGSGFDNPILFYQSLFIRAWYAKV